MYLGSCAQIWIWIFKTRKYRGRPAAEPPGRVKRMAFGRNFRKLNAVRIWNCHLFHQSWKKEENRHFRCWNGNSKLEQQLINEKGIYQKGKNVCILLKWYFLLNWKSLTKLHYSNVNKETNRVMQSTWISQKSYKSYISYQQASTDDKDLYLFGNRK